MYKRAIRRPLNWKSTNQLPNKVLSVKATLAGTSIDAYLEDCSLYFIAGNGSRGPAVLGCSEIQNADVVALLPLCVLYQSEKGFRLAFSDLGGKGIDRSAGYLEKALVSKDLRYPLNGPISKGYNEFEMLLPMTTPNCRTCTVDLGIQFSRT